MSSISDIFKKYKSYGNIPVIGIINWDVGIAPDANVCIAFIFNYLIIAFSTTGSVFTSTPDTPIWNKRR